MRVAPYSLLSAYFLLVLSAHAAAPADLDRDGDVDLEDFGRFQVCFSGADTPQADPACAAARLDDDSDVDLSDFGLFQQCISGPSVPAAPPCTPQGIQFFPRGALWYRDVTYAPVDAQSAQVISWLSTQGWGFGRMQIDFSIEVLVADESTPFRTFIKTGDFWSPDCDHAPMPVPVGGAIEGETGYACLSGGDCHLLVVHPIQRKLYEMYRANIVGSTFYGGCLAIWDMTRVYGPSGRGVQCTSADAAGFPIAPLLFNADEVAAGWIDHAIRFILPNPRMRAGVFCHPATHAGAPSGPASAPPYGAHFRLRADFPLANLPNEGARVVARAMQRYGMFLADGGNIALTAQSDRFTTHKWAGLLGPHDLRAIQVSDFQMLESGTCHTLTYDCVREP